MQLRLAALVLFLGASASATVTNVTDAAGLITAVAGSAAGDTINIQSGTPYVLTTSLSLPHSISLIGYQTTPGDGGTPPLITTATNSIALFLLASADGLATWNIFSNLTLISTAGTPGAGIDVNNGFANYPGLAVTACKLTGFSRAIGTNSGLLKSINIIRTELSANAFGFNGGDAPLTIRDCWIHDNTVGVYYSFPDQFPISVTRSVISKNVSNLRITTSGGPILIAGSTISLATGTDPSHNGADGWGVLLDGPNGPVTFESNIVYGNGSWGLRLAGGTLVSVAGGNNAFGANAEGDRSGFSALPGDIALTANPFTSSGAGDYSLNSTAGGGAASRGAGFPGAFPGGLSVGHLDIGAVQSAVPAAPAVGFASP